MSYCTVVRDDGPGHGGGIDASNHPEHAEPAQVLAALLPGQRLRKVGEHDGHCPTNPGKNGERLRLQKLQSFKKAIYVTVKHITKHDKNGRHTVQYRRHIHIQIQHPSSLASILNSQ